MTATGSRRARTWRTASVLVLLAAAVAAIAAWTLRPQESATDFTMPSPTFDTLAIRTTGPCEHPATSPFAPTSISIPDVIKDAKILALPRDANNVPRVPPTSAKSTFAWDRPPGIEPGSDRGNVLLNAHTWPDGSAVGNTMLSKLDEGDRMILRGGGSELCYTVTKRIEVLASKGYAPYYDRDGKPQVALIVCSGKRLGPGVWTHRTIWFAEPGT